MTFRATLLLHGKSATGIEVPPEVVDALSAGKKPPVRVTINGHAYRTTVAPRGGRFLLPVSAEHRAAAGIAAGDEIAVDIEHDAAPRTVEVPADLRAALDETGVGEAFDALAYSHRKEHVRAIEEAKKPETRERRIAKAIEMLGG